MLLRFLLSAVAMLLLQHSSSRAALAQANWPERPITVIVPGPAGSSTDVVARLATREMSKKLGQPFVIENRPGGDGIIGTRMAAHSAPDGYTIIVGSNNAFSGAPVIHGSALPYDPIKDFVPVSLVAEAPYLLAIYPGLGVATVEELVKLAKAKPGTLNYSSIGESSASRKGMVAFARQTGLDLMHIPYKSSAQSIIDLAAGTIHLQLATIPPTLSLMQAGKVKALAITSAKRIKQLPEIPTMQEAGVSGYEALYWLAMFAPAKTPPAIIESLNSALRESLTMPTVRDALTIQGFSEAKGTTPEEMSRILQADINAFREAYPELGAKPAKP